MNKCEIYAVSGILRTAVSVACPGSTNAAVRELIDSGVQWPARNMVEIPLYRPALEEDTSGNEDGDNDNNGENIHGEWRPLALLPKYHNK